TADPAPAPTAHPAPTSQQTPATTPAPAEASSTPPHDPALDDDLLAAAAADDADRVRDLLARGADIEARGPHQRTPLIEATKNRATDAARALIEAGADVNATDAIGDSAYLYAGAEGLDAILDLTLTHGADLT